MVAARGTHQSAPRSHRPRHRPPVASCTGPALVVSRGVVVTLANFIILTECVNQYLAVLKVVFGALYTLNLSSLRCSRLCKLLQNFETSAVEQEGGVGGDRLRWWCSLLPGAPHSTTRL